MQTDKSYVDLNLMNYFNPVSSAQNINMILS